MNAKHEDLQQKYFHTCWQPRISEKAEKIQQESEQEFQSVFELPVTDTLEELMPAADNEPDTDLKKTWLGLYSTRYIPKIMEFKHHNTLTNKTIKDILIVKKQKYYSVIDFSGNLIPKCDTINNLRAAINHRWLMVRREIGWLMKDMEVDYMSYGQLAELCKRPPTSIDRDYRFK